MLVNRRVILLFAAWGSVPVRWLLSDEGSISKRLQKAIDLGRGFLVGLFDGELNLLPEYRDAKVYWLYHDNYLAAKVLEGTEPELAGKIREAIRSYGVVRSGKIEIVFGESPRALPFRQYELKDVRRVGEKLIRTEVVKPEVFRGCERYADLLFFAAMAEKDRARGLKNFRAGLAMWDGMGFKDDVVMHQKQYATYKLGLALIAAQHLKVEVPQRVAIVERLLAMQGPAGGWITDYDLTGKPLGLANVETTSLAILGLQTGL